MRSIIAALLSLPGLSPSAAELPDAEVTSASPLIGQSISRIHAAAFDADPFDTDTDDGDSDDDAGDDVALPVACILTAPDELDLHPAQHVTLGETQSVPRRVFHPPRLLHA